MKSAGKARNNGLYRHIRTSKEIIRNLLNDLYIFYKQYCFLQALLYIIFIQKTKIGFFSNFLTLRLFYQIITFYYSLSCSI